MNHESSRAALAPRPYEPERSSRGEPPGRPDGGGGSLQPQGGLRPAPSSTRMPDRKCHPDDSESLKSVGEEEEPAAPASDSPPQDQYQQAASSSVTPSPPMRSPSSPKSPADVPSGDAAFIDHASREEADTSAGRVPMSQSTALARAEGESVPRRPAGDNAAGASGAGSESASLPQEFAYSPSGVTLMPPISLTSGAGDSTPPVERRRGKYAAVNSAGDTPSGRPDAGNMGSGGNSSGGDVAVDEDYSSIDIEGLAMNPSIYGGAAPTWSPMHRYRHHLDDLQGSLEGKTGSPKQAERELLAVARFVVGDYGAEESRKRRQAIARSDIPLAAVSVLQKHASDRRTATVGCSVLSVLATNDALMQQGLGRAGAVQAIVLCVERNEGGDPRMTESGLRALSSLAYFPENRERIREQRGIEVIVSAMGNHSQSVSVQTEGATLLANYAFGSEENKKVISAGFGIDLLVTAMKTYPAERELQGRACQALRNITFNAPSILSSAGAKGAVTAALDALSGHLLAEDVIEQGIVAIFNMVTPHPPNADRLASVSSHMTVLLEALRAYSESERIQTAALAIMESVLRRRPEALPPLLETGGVQDIVAAMKGAITQPGVMRQGASCLLAILAVEECKQVTLDSIKEAGGLESLLELLYIAVTYKPKAELEARERGGRRVIRLPPGSEVDASGRRIEFE